MIREFYTKLTFSLTVKIFLSSPRRHTGGAEVWLHSFLTSALDGSEWSRHIPQDRTPWYPLKSRQDTPPPPPTHPQPIHRFGEGTKNSCAYRIRTPDRPARRLIATPTQPSQLLTPEMPPSIHYFFSKSAQRFSSYDIT